METSFGYYFKHLEAFPLPELLDGIEEPWQLLVRVTEWFQERGTHIGRGTKVPAGANVIGPVWLGRNVEIMPGALIRPYSIIGDGCAVGHGSEIKHSVMFNGAKVGSLAFVGDSILGKSARIGSGAITANRNFNQGGIRCRGRELHSDYFGAVIGDNTRIGANCVTQPGTHIGAYTWVYPMTNVRGFIPERLRVYHPRELASEPNEAIDLK